MMSLQYDIDFKCIHCHEQTYSLNKPIISFEDCSGGPRMVVAGFCISCSMLPKGHICELCR